MKKMAICLLLIFVLVSCVNSPSSTAYPTSTFLPIKTPTPEPIILHPTIIPTPESIPVFINTEGDLAEFIERGFSDDGEMNIEVYTVESPPIGFYLGDDLSNHIAKQVVNWYEQTMDEKGWKLLDNRLADQEEYNYLHNTSFKEWKLGWEKGGNLAIVIVTPRPSQVILTLAIGPR